MNTQPLKRVNILGVGVHAIDIQIALQVCDSAVQDSSSSKAQYVCITGVHGIMEAQSDHELRGILNRSLLTTPDGMPTVWIGRLSGFHLMRRVFGPEFMSAFCRVSVERGYTHFLYGGEIKVAEELQKNLERLYPGIKIVGTHCPPFRPLNPEEEARLIETFSDLKPQVTWIGLSTPKQERFMARYASKLNTKLMLGVGAAFDYHTGRIMDAPAWMKECGLQWAHRLIQEPRRLWKRYAINNPKFVCKVVGQKSRLVHYRLSE
jgi:N-acetylglucosaminyldiphosphoundecaprenol N-acetyl-beta-D-mannosaminyltransferase